MKAIAFPIIVPRFKADGTRNRIDTQSATIGDDIKQLLSASLSADERIYPFNRCENVSFERTETQYETSASGNKYRLDGVGGIRSLKVENWGKDAVLPVLKEMKKFGCSDFDVFLIDVAGNLWGVKDSADDQYLHGYPVASNTFDSFYDFATDSTTAKIMTSWDFEDGFCVENSFPIVPAELGYKATTLRPNISAVTVATALTDTTLEVKVYDAFGTAVNVSGVTGLLDANFVITNQTIDSTIPSVTSVENENGVYVLTIPAQTTGDALIIDVLNATGYDVDSSSATAL